MMKMKMMMVLTDDLKECLPVLPVHEAIYEWVAGRVAVSNPD